MKIHQNEPRDVDELAGIHQYLLWPSDANLQTQRCKLTSWLIHFLIIYVLCSHFICVIHFINLAIFYKQLFRIELIVMPQVKRPTSRNGSAVIQEEIKAKHQQLTEAIKYCRKHNVKGIRGGSWVKMANHFHFQVWYNAEFLLLRTFYIFQLS